MSRPAHELTPTQNGNCQWIWPLEQPDPLAV